MYFSKKERSLFNEVLNGISFFKTKDFQYVSTFNENGYGGGWSPSFIFGALHAFSGGIYFHFNGRIKFCSDL